MSLPPSPRLILETLFPHLKVAAGYARHIQSRIAARPSKDVDSFLGAALSDADLSIQTLVEVALLGTFPHLRFYGEEYEQSYNTKYFRSITLGDEQDDYLITLDPIDGTRYYLDGHSNYQIILGVLNRDEFEAAIAITPALHTYCYALRGAGCWQGRLDEDLDAAIPLRVEDPKPAILLGMGMEAMTSGLIDHYQVIAVSTSYSDAMQIPNVNGMLNGELSGAVTRGGKFIDGAALAFMAQEAGCIVTTLTGAPPPPLYACENYGRSALLIAASPSVHQHMVAAAQAMAGQ